MSAIDSLAAELLEAIVRRVETDPALAARLRGVLGAEPQAPQGAPFMRVEEYAARRGFSRKSVERWIRSGMPSLGEGVGRRVDVERADAWLRARSNNTDVSEAEAAERGAAAARLTVVR